MVGRESSFSTDKWNIAKGYVEFKILKPLIECDILREIALFGFESISEAVYTPPENKSQIRLEAIKRLHLRLSIIRSNSVEFVDSKSGKATITKTKENLDEIESMFDGLSIVKTDVRNNTTITEIYEPHFKATLNALVLIKEELLQTLDDAGLIFPISEEYDVEDMKRRFIEGG